MSGERFARVAAAVNYTLMVELTKKEIIVGSIATVAYALSMVALCTLRACRWFFGSWLMLARRLV